MTKPKILTVWIALTLVGSTLWVVAQETSQKTETNGRSTNPSEPDVRSPKSPNLSRPRAPERVGVPSGEPPAKRIYAPQAQVPGNPPIFEAEKGVAQGILAEERGRTEEAIETYRRTIDQFDRQRSHVAQAIFRLAEAYREQGKIAEADVLYARILREFPDQFELARMAHRRMFPERTSTPEPESVDSSARSGRRPIMSSDPDQIDLRVMSVDREAQIPDQGRRLIIVAKIGDNLHVRGFDEDGHREFDIAEGELAPDKTRAVKELKELLAPHWDHPARLLGQHEEQVINRVTSILRGALSDGSRKKAMVIKNLNGLKQILLGIRIYADDHGGSLPKRLKAIQSGVKERHLREICRRINENGRLVYLPHPPKMSHIKDPDETAILFARLDLEPTVVLVGYANGKVEKVDQDFLRVLRSALEPYASGKAQRRATMILDSRLLVDSDRQGLSNEAKTLTEIVGEAARTVDVNNEVTPYAAVTIRLDKVDEESTLERRDPTEIPWTPSLETPGDALKYMVMGIQSYAANAEGRLPANLGEITEHLGGRKQFEKVIRLFSAPSSKKSGGVVYIRPADRMSAIPDKAKTAVLVGIPPRSDAVHVAYADGHVTAHEVSNGKETMAAITTILTDKLKEIKELYTKPVVRLGLHKSMPFQSVVALHEMFSQLEIEAKFSSISEDSGDGIMLLLFEEGAD